MPSTFEDKQSFDTRLPDGTIEWRNKDGLLHQETYQVPTRILPNRDEEYYYRGVLYAVLQNGKTEVKNHVLFESIGTENMPTHITPDGYMEWRDHRGKLSGPGRFRPAVIHANGDEDFYHVGVFYGKKVGGKNQIANQRLYEYIKKNDAPTFVDEQGNMFWEQYGIRGRTDNKPSVVYANGDSDFYYDGQEYKRIRDGQEQIVHQGLFDAIAENDPPNHITSDGEMRWEGRKHSKDTNKPAVVYANGDSDFYFAGKEYKRVRNGEEVVLNSLLYEAIKEGDPPSSVGVNGMCWYNKSGKLHREGGKPAMVHDDEHYDFHYQGVRYLTIKNGKEHVNISKLALYNSIQENDPPTYLRNDGNTLIWSQPGTWHGGVLHYGKRHREGGKPAVIHSNGTKEFYFEGEKYAEETPEGKKKIINKKVYKQSLKDEEKKEALTKMSGGGIRGRIARLTANDEEEDLFKYVEKFEEDSAMYKELDNLLELSQFLDKQIIELKQSFNKYQYTAADTERFTVIGEVVSTEKQEYKIDKELLDELDLDSTIAASVIDPYLKTSLAEVVQGYEIFKQNIFQDIETFANMPRGCNVGVGLTSQDLKNRPVLPNHLKACESWIFKPGANKSNFRVVEEHGALNLYVLNKQDEIDQKAKLLYEAMKAFLDEETVRSWSINLEDKLAAAKNLTEKFEEETRLVIEHNKQLVQEAREAVIGLLNSRDNTQEIKGESREYIKRWSVEF